MKTKSKKAKRIRKRLEDLEEMQKSKV